MTPDDLAAIQRDVIQAKTMSEFEAKAEAAANAGLDIRELGAALARWLYSLSRELTRKLSHGIFTRYPADDPDQALRVIAEATGLPLARVSATLDSELYSSSIVTLPTRNRPAQVVLDAAQVSACLGSHGFAIDPVLIKVEETQARVAYVRLMQRTARERERDRDAISRRLPAPRPLPAPVREAGLPEEISVMPVVPDVAGHDLKPDPLRATTGAHFVELLGELHLWAGEPPLRRLARSTNGQVAHSTLSMMLSSQQMPTLRTVQLFVRALGCDEDDVSAWTTAWRKLRFDRRGCHRPGPRGIVGGAATA